MNRPIMQQNVPCIPPQTTVLPPYKEPPPPYRLPNEPRLPDIIPNKAKLGLPPPPQLTPRPRLPVKHEDCKARPSMTPPAADRLLQHQTRSAQQEVRPLHRTETLHQASPSPPADDVRKALPYSWTNIDAVKLPILLRGETAYLAVKMVETKLLSKYPNSYPKGVRERPPLSSHYVSPKEIHTLNMLNREFMDSVYGDCPFGVNDLIVKMDDFIEFYSTVKTSFQSKSNLFKFNILYVEIFFTTLKKATIRLLINI